MAKVKRKAKLATKKKVWLELLSTAFFQNASLGETCVFEPGDAMGRVVTVNLSQLMRDPKRQNINVSFRVYSIDQQKLKTSIVKYQMIPASLKRFVRRNKSKVDDSFVAISADGKRLRIKPLLITKAKVPKSMQTTLRMKLRAQLITMLRKMSANDFFEYVLLRKQQKESFDLLKKIYPLSGCEIRSLEILSEGAGIAQEKEEESSTSKKAKHTGEENFQASESQQKPSPSESQETSTEQSESEQVQAEA